MEIVFDEASEKARNLLRLLRQSPLLVDGLVLVLGGDGTMLKAAHQYNFTPVFLGINCGHKGFLMNDDDVSDAADRILRAKFKVYQFPLLHLEAENGWEGLAMGDVYFNRITGQTCKVNVRVNGVEIARRISGDGIVICTALGSAGYFVPKSERRVRLAFWKDENFTDRMVRKIMKVPEEE